MKTHYSYPLKHIIIHTYLYMHYAHLVLHSHARIGRTFLRISMHEKNLWKRSSIASLHLPIGYSVQVCVGHTRPVRQRWRLCCNNRGTRAERDAGKALSGPPSKAFSLMLYSLQQHCVQQRDISIAIFGDFVFLSWRWSITRDFGMKRVKDIEVLRLEQEKESEANKKEERTRGRGRGREDKTESTTEVRKRETKEGKEHESKERENGQRGRAVMGIHSSLSLLTLPIAPALLRYPSFRSIAIVLCMVVTIAAWRCIHAMRTPRSWCSKLVCIFYVNLYDGYYGLRLRLLCN